MMFSVGGAKLVAERDGSSVGVNAKKKCKKHYVTTQLAGEREATQKKPQMLKGKAVYCSSNEGSLVNKAENKPRKRAGGCCLTQKNKYNKRRTHSELNLKSI